MVFEKKLSSYSQQSNAFSSYCIVVSWLVLGEKYSLGFLNLESLPQEHRPRLTKCKDSENDSVTFQP